MYDLTWSTFTEKCWKINFPGWVGFGAAAAYLGAAAAYLGAAAAYLGAAAAYLD